MADDIPQASVDATKASGLIIVLQLIGTFCLITAGFLLYSIISSSNLLDVMQLLGLIFMGIGMILGLVGLWGSIPFDIIELTKLDIVPSLNNLFVMATVLCLILASIIGVWGSRIYTDVGKLTSLDILTVAAFSFLLVGFLELASTSNHLFHQEVRKEEQPEEGEPESQPAFLQIPALVLHPVRTDLHLFLVRSGPPERDHPDDG